MKRSLLLVIGWCLVLPAMSLAEAPADVTQSPACRHCGMDRAKFAHSRMLVTYEDGSRAATCSLHCTAVELANAIDKTPLWLQVADYDSKELLDVDQAVWVMDGNKGGVMTSRAKWAFSSREAAERFIQAQGGSMIKFDAAIKAAYDDMYQDTIAIRERRKMKMLKPQSTTATP